MLERGRVFKQLHHHKAGTAGNCREQPARARGRCETLGSLDGAHIFFPDPWHKTKHNKRRLIQSPLIAKLAARLKPGGYLHCATDWQPYAEQILEVLSAEPLLKNTADAAGDGYAPKPDYRPLTKFENRGIKLGHGVWDVVFTRV